jgi:enoyl-CoA hydratase
MPEPLLYERDGDVAVLTLNRPEALNALSSALLRELVRQLDACDADPSIGAIVLTGQGERAFTAGMDLKEAAQGTDAIAGADADPAAALDRCRTTVIVAVNGLCITGGMEIILATDMVLASENARFADTHVRVGLLPGWGISQRLARQVGPQRAKELSLTGNPIDAQRAFDIGLVNRVVPAGELMRAALQLAHDVARSDQRVVQAYKSLIDDGYAVSMAEGFELERTRGAEHLASLGSSAISAGHESAQARNRAQLRQPSATD